MILSETRNFNLHLFGITYRKFFHKGERKLTNKELILDCLIQDDEAFTQIVEYFVLAAEVDISHFEVKRLLAEMLDEGYICVNYNWKTEHDEYPYSLNEKGKRAWEEIKE